MRERVKESRLHTITGVAIIILMAVCMLWWPGRTMVAHAAESSGESEVTLSGTAKYIDTSTLGGETVANSEGFSFEYQVCGTDEVCISGYRYSAPNQQTSEKVRLILPTKIEEEGRQTPYTVVGINGRVFANSTNFDEVQFGYTYRWIGEEAFMNSAIKGALRFDANLTTIRNRAFYGCSGLEDVMIGVNVTSIETGVFANCSSLTKIAVEHGNGSYCGDDGVLYSYDKTMLIQWPAGLTVATSGVTSFTVGSAQFPIRVVGNQAFEGCTSLQNVDFYSTVTTIGEKAFYGCTNLSRATIPDTVLTIQSDSFSNCSPGLVIACDKGSYAETYAKSRGISVSVTCTVNFYDGTTLLKTERVPVGGSASAPIVSERSGYTLTWDKSYTNVQQNLNVYTSWKQNYTVTFKDEYSGQVTEVLSYYGGSATPPVWTRKGYILGWDTTSYTYVTKDLTVNAVWLVSMTDGAITEEKPQIGDTRTINYITYQVVRTTSSDPRVRAVGCTKQTLTTLTIPDRITFGGVNYKVTSIGANAFRDMPKLTTLTIGTNMLKIYRAAFYNCPKLKTITIRSKKITGVSAKAFSKTYVKAKVNVPNAYIKKYKTYLQDAGLSVYATVY